MHRDLLLLEEMTAACRRALEIATRQAVGDLASSPDARDALLGNLTVPGEAPSQVSTALRDAHPDR